MLLFISSTLSFNGYIGRLSHALCVEYICDNYMYVQIADCQERLQAVLDSRKTLVPLQVCREMELCIREMEVLPTKNLMVLPRP